jgi:hypothetical protein
MTFENLLARRSRRFVFSLLLAIGDRYLLHVVIDDSYLRWYVLILITHIGRVTLPTTDEVLPSGTIVNIAGAPFDIDFSNV